MDTKRLEGLQEARKWRQRTGSKFLRTTFPDAIWKYLNCTTKGAYLRGGNGGGKSVAQGWFVAAALLGRYPQNYGGWKPTPNPNDIYSVTAIVMSQSGQVLRDTLQMHILGDVAGGNQGNGFVPADAIVSIQMARGVAGQVDFAIIRRDDATLAKLYFRTYEQGRVGLQGIRASLIVADELFDDEELLGEILGRFSGVTNGIFRLSSTERFQQTTVAQWFYEDPVARPIFSFSLDDITWMPAAEKKAFYDSLPEAERDTRYHGARYAGAGSVMQTPVEHLLDDINPAAFPPYYAHLVALDFSHFGTSSTSSQFAALFMAKNPYTGVIHVFHEILMRGGPNDHVAAINAQGGRGVLCVWPHDGQQGQALGENIAALYKRAGLKMHPTWATFGPGSDGGYNFESGVQLINSLAASGRLKISRHGCPKLQAQWTAYERDDKGQVIKKNDDAMSALRIGCMMMDAKPCPAKPLPEFLEAAGTLRPDGSDRRFAIGTFDDPLSWGGSNFDPHTGQSSPASIDDIVNAATRWRQS